MKYAVHESIITDWFDLLVSVELAPIALHYLGKTGQGRVLLGKLSRALVVLTKDVGGIVGHLALQH